VKDEWIVLAKADRQIVVFDLGFFFGELIF